MFLDTRLDWLALPVIRDETPVEISTLRLSASASRRAREQKKSMFNGVFICVTLAVFGYRLVSLYLIEHSCSFIKYRSEKRPVVFIRFVFHLNMKQCKKNKSLFHDSITIKLKERIYCFFYKWIIFLKHFFKNFFETFKRDLTKTCFCFILSAQRNKVQWRQASPKHRLKFQEFVKIVETEPSAVTVIGTYRACFKPSVCLSLSLSLCLSLSPCLSLWLSLSLSPCLSLCLSVSLSLWLSLCLSVCLSLSLWLSPRVFIPDRTFLLVY